MTVRLERLKGMDRFNPSKRKEYRDIKKFIKTIEKRTKEASSNKEGYIQQLQELDKQLKQGTLRNFEQIMGGSKSSVPLSHSTPNMDRPPALPPRVGR